MLKGNEWIERERKNKKNVTVQLCHSLTQKIRHLSLSFFVTNDERNHEDLQHILSC